MLRLAFISIALLTACAHSNFDRHPAAAPSACEQWTDDVTPEQQAIINSMMGARDHRLQHALWHSVRGGLSPQDQSKLLASFGPSWSKFHPLCPAPDLNINPAGEDFLYMHHGMIEMLRESFLQANQPCIRGWKTSKEWPAPTGRSRQNAKSPETLALMQKWDAHFQDPEWLRQHSLSQVGWALESSVHNNLHMRYATDLPPKGFDQDGAPLTLDGHFPEGWIYDDPRYNWLADPYGAAVNPIFWKIHGYVDQVIDGWLAAHDYTSIADDCAGDRKCYQWKGRWTGELEHPRGTPIAPPRAEPPMSADDLRKLTKRRIDIQRAGVLKDEDFRPKLGSARGPIGAPQGPSEDPFEFAKARLCP